MGLFKTIEEAEEVVQKIFDAVQTVEKGLAEVTADFTGFKGEVNKGLQDGKDAIKELKGTFQRKALTEPEPKKEPEGPSAIETLAGSKAPK